MDSFNYIARIGFLDNKKYEICVKTDDDEKIPHIHIFDTKTTGKDFDCSIRLDTNCFLSHRYIQSIMNSSMCKQFNDFMRQPCRSPKYKNNYEFAVEMWNDNNSDTYIQIKEDENGNIIMPDYTTILPYK